MTIIPITPTEPACFGILCPRHEHCARYHAIEDNPAVRIDSCEEAPEVRPLFVQREQLVELASRAGQA